MNVVMISGGLGNQMFQYALCIAFNKRGVLIKIDNSKYTYYQVHNNYELDKVFKINAPIATLEEIKKYGYVNDNKLMKLLRKSPFKKKSLYLEKSMEFDDQVLSCDEKYILGYWQNERYFEDCKEEILEAFQFPKIDSPNLEALVGDIKKFNSVSVHIRRGDYLDHPLYKGICTIEYYQAAIQYLAKELREEIHLFVFSNDIEWVRENLHYSRMTIVEGNSGEYSYRDMQLMSLCKHNIIANSSFSWWGAWLNQNMNKIVIAPNKWVNVKNKGTNSIVPLTWIRL